MFALFAAMYLGWTLGANDTANVFGTGVASELITYRVATFLTAVFVIIGAAIEGPKVMNTIGGLTSFVSRTAFVAVLAAAMTVTLMTCLKLPVSTSQAIVGAIVGVALATGGLGGVPGGKLLKMVLCWIFTPLGAAVISILLFIILAPIVNKVIESFLTFALLMRVGTVAVGCYGAYTLGANNVANVTGAFVGANLFSPLEAALIGGAAIAIGAITYSRGVMISVGRKIFPLGPFSAFVAVLAAALTLQIFTELKVPVSNSQAIVGSVAGIGLLRGTKAINKKMLFSVFSGWITTPILAGIISFLFCLQGL